MEMGSIPQGKYCLAKRYGNLIYTAGMTPRQNGKLILTEKISTDKPLAYYRDVMRLAVKNALKAAESVVNGGEYIHSVLNMTVVIRSDEEFKDHPKLADYASDYLVEILGKQGIGGRITFGVSSLPGGAPVEIQLVVLVSKI